MVWGSMTDRLTVDQRLYFGDRRLKTPKSTLSRRLKWRVAKWVSFLTLCLRQERKTGTRWFHTRDTLVTGALSRHSPALRRVRSIHCHPLPLSTIRDYILFSRGDIALFITHPLTRSLPYPFCPCFQQRCPLTVDYPG